MKKVLLVGDSIRMSYNAAVTELLRGKADVWGPDDNCRFAKYTLWEINNWMGMGGKGKPDIIHWNNGIWDTFRISGDVEPFTGIDEYVRDMLAVLNEMKRSGAEIIFATTTPVREQLTATNTERIKEYNRAMLEALSTEQVVINDLFSVIARDTDGYIGEDFLHLNEKGVDAAARAVAAAIENQLGQR